MLAQRNDLIALATCSAEVKVIGETVAKASCCQMHQIAAYVQLFTGMCYASGLPEAFCEELSNMLDAKIEAFYDANGKPLSASH
jgi:hypothetical protein